MISDIEALDKKRLKYLEGYLFGFAIFLILTIVRFFFRADGLNSQPIGIAVLIGLFVTLIMQAYCMIGTMRVARKIHDDPQLEEALNNEFVQSIETQSWKAAYLGAAGSTLFFAIAWFLYPICDPVMVALTAIITGAGAYRANFYFKYRSS
jgi:lysylphosphatidylglycerol synthetase-like protein (DUF2156 family)